jgi:hypothetical protein
MMKILLSKATTVTFANKAVTFAQKYSCEALLIFVIYTKYHAKLSSGSLAAPSRQMDRQT